jgi:hypothetical protein
LRDTHELIVTGVCVRAVTHVSITGPMRVASREFFLLLFYSFILFLPHFFIFSLVFFCSHSFMLVSCYQTQTTRDDPVYWKNIKPRFWPDPRDRDLYAHAHAAEMTPHSGWPLASSRASIFTLFRFFRSVLIRTTRNIYINAVVTII